MKVTAKALISIEVDIPGGWNGDAKMDQIEKTSKIEAINMVRKLIASNNEFHLLGDAKIKAIIVEE